MDITVKVTGIDDVISELSNYAVRQKATELCSRLASMGAVKVSLDYARAVYTGENDISVSVEEIGDGRFSITASGAVVLIVEFGAGITYGDGHPLAGQYGYGPGTYPGQTHALDPAGWWLPKAKRGTAADEYQHTYGNPPSMTMYNTAKDLKDEIQRVAMEVFNS